MQKHVIGTKMQRSETQRHLDQNEAKRNEGRDLSAYAQENCVEQTDFSSPKNAVASHEQYLSSNYSFNSFDLQKLQVTKQEAEISIYFALNARH